MILGLRNIQVGDDKEVPLIAGFFPVETSEDILSATCPYSDRGGTGS
jgi:hypothetical protein